MVASPLVEFWVPEVGPSLWVAVGVAVDVGPRGGADELVFAVDLVDEGSAGVTGADGGASDIGALDRVVDGLASPESLAS